MSKSPWGNIGNWAAEAERAEEEEREAAEKAAAAQPPPSTFPSLKDSVSTAAKQKKKTKMTLQEFYSGSSASRGLTPEEMLRLPTGPKERSPDEYGRLGGGFSNYGTRPGSGGSGQGQGRDYEGRRSYGFQDDDRRGGPPQARVSEMEPSRADGVDNWASMKKQTIPEYNSGQDRPGGRYSSLGGGGGPGAASRADEVDNWASVKKPFSTPQQQPRSSSFGSGFSRRDTDRWTRNEQRVVSDSPKFEVADVVKVNKPNPFGAARPREEVLSEKGLDCKKLDLEIEGKKKQSVSGGSRPGSSHSSRPDSPLSSGGVGEGVVNPKPKVNPFGNAKPREILLEEKGLDWKKIDLELEHRRVQRPETEEEKNLKEEINLLKKEMLQKSGDEQSSINDLILQRERELDLLIKQLDVKVRYRPKNMDRPGSVSGRSYEEPKSGYSERPGSRSGMYEDPIPRSYEDPRPPSRPGSRDRPHSRQGAYEEPRGGFPQRSTFSSGTYQEPRADYNERPRSRGSGNSWSDERRGSQGGGGFLGSRDVDRSASRW